MLLLLSSSALFSSPRTIVTLSCYCHYPRLFLVCQTVYLPAQSAIVPKLGLTQICIPKHMSLGKMPVLFSLLQQATGRQELSALIDISDRFDAGAAESAGVDLSRLLWVRCGKRKPSPADRPKRPEFRGGEGKRVAPLKSLTVLNLPGPLDSLDPLNFMDPMNPMNPLEPLRALNPMRPIKSSKLLKPLEQAFKAADILIQNGGLELIVIDLGEIEEGLVRKIPLTTWFRFARVIEKQPTALVVFATYPAAQSCAALTLHIKNPEAHWNTEAKSEARAHSNQQKHSDLRFSSSQDSDGVEQQVIGAQQQTVDDQKQVRENVCQADRKAITHAQFLAGLTYEVEVGRVRGQPAQQSDIDLWCLKYGSKSRS